MTAMMIGPNDARPLEPVARESAPAWPRAERTDLGELRSLLLELRGAVADQRRTLDALDARREQLDDLIADAMPIANAALSMVARRAGALDDRRRSFATIPAALDAIRTTPAPSLLSLLWSLRDRDVRKTLALMIEGMRLAGRLAEGDAPRAARGDANRMLELKTTPIPRAL